MANILFHNNCHSFDVISLHFFCENFIGNSQIHTPKKTFFFDTLTHLHTNTHTHLKCALVLILEKQIYLCFYSFG